MYVTDEMGEGVSSVFIHKAFNFGAAVQGNQLNNFEHRVFSKNRVQRLPVAIIDNVTVAGGQLVQLEFVVSS